MVVGSGISSQLGFAPEGTWATPTTTAMRFIPFNKESLGLDTNMIQSEGLDAGGLYDRDDMYARVSRMAKGDFEFHTPSKGMGLIWQGAIGSWTAGVPTQIATSGVYTQVHQPGSHQGKGLTIQKNAPDANGVSHAYTYNGCKFVDWELGCKVGEFATFKATVDGQDERTPTSAPVAGLALAAASFPAYDGGLFHFAEGQLLSGGTLSQTSGVWSVAGNAAVANVKDASVKQQTPMAIDRIFYNTAPLKQEQIENGKRKGTGQFTFEFGDETLYQQFRNDTAMVIVLKFVGPVIGSSGTNRATMEILLTSLRLEGESPKVGGPGIIECSSSFSWRQPASAAPPIQVTLTSSDSTI